jgi:hypothetical protein
MSNRRKLIGTSSAKKDLMYARMLRRDVLPLVYTIQEEGNLLQFRKLELAKQSTSKVTKKDFCSIATKI